MGEAVEEGHRETLGERSGEREGEAQGDAEVEGGGERVGDALAIMEREPQREGDEEPLRVDEGEDEGHRDGAGEALEDKDGKGVRLSREAEENAEGMGDMEKEALPHVLAEKEGNGVEVALGVVLRV